ncbi:L-seryl-tRNA(Sec) kinase isoform X3 [Tursiops truncatus]|uniref:L-seryl-tRNA(Sec) kinase isoform X1 n=1 Tax=Tursiops truncatus TaxID=9739 RepID=A0A2U4BRE9_TURTR|nr:L-seryl-tRNA(Sec) kinase isoform X1 [Tursiops truncatus]XP_030687837.1 L-seryl-tRNA(Sec) kinase isoform X1 [Globicephala melas]
MKAGEDARGARSEKPKKLGLCVLCGLPAAGKSTFARALSHRLRQESSWAVGVVAYDDVMPDAFLEEASARPLTKAMELIQSPRPSQWKSLRQELLKYLEYFFLAVINGCQMSAPPSRTEAMWEDFLTCLKDQDLISSSALEAQSHYLLTKTAVSRPLLLILDDNFYYQSMRYEVYQLARKYSLGFCQLFLECSLETCLQRNGQRPLPVPAETIHLMGSKIEKPNPEKNAWEHNSLTIQSPACTSEARLKLTDLLLTALENPIKYVEENVEQKETDRIICSTNILHQADQTLRRIVSQTMKEAKGEQLFPYNLKLLAEELNKLKAEFLEDLRQGNKKYLCFQQTMDLSDVISFFHYEKDNIVRKYFSKQH